MPETNSPIPASSAPPPPASSAPSTIEEAIKRYNFSNECPYTLKQRIKHLPHGKSVFGWSFLFKYCCGEISKLEYMMEIEIPDLIHPMLNTLYKNRYPKLFMLFPHIVKLDIWIKNYKIDLNVCCGSNLPLITFIPKSIFKKVIDSIDFEAYTPSTWQPTFYKICSRYVDLKKYTNLGVLENIAEGFDNYMKSADYNYEVLIDTIKDYYGAIKNLYLVPLPPNHKYAPLKEFLTSRWESGCTFFLTRFIISLLDTNKETAYQMIGRILEKERMSYSLFRHNTFYDHLIDIIDMFKIDTKSEYYGSAMILYVIQFGRFDIASKLLDKGAVIIEDGKMIVNENGWNVYMFAPKNLNPDGGDELEIHQQKVHEFLMKYYENNDEVRSILEKVDITTGKIKEPFPDTVPAPVPAPVPAISPTGTQVAILKARKLASLLMKKTKATKCYIEFRKNKIIEELNKIFEEYDLSWTDIETD